MNLLGLGVGAIVGISMGVLVLLIIVYYWATNNTLIKKKNDAEEAFATMDVYLKKRYDLVPNLVETVKGYAKHEKDTLTNIIEMRNKAVSAQTIDEKVKAENNLAAGLKTIFALAENYPQLKADTNFYNLQNQLMALENDIANSRKYYNAVVKSFNNTIQIFPNSIIARAQNYKKMSMFVVDDEAERKNVQVKF